MSVIYDGCQSCMIDVTYGECPSLINVMDVHHWLIWSMSIIYENDLWIWWMYIIYEWDECPSCLTYAHIEFWMPVIYIWWNQWNLLVGGRNWEDMVSCEAHMELMESEWGGYETDWINRTGERETIGQKLDGIEGKDWNDRIRMALMGFMKLMEPTKLMERLLFIELIYMMKLMEHMKIIG